MLPLYLADKNEDLIIRRVSGNEEIVRHVRELGLAEGGIVRVISDAGGNLIVQVKESRLAISFELAKRIYV